MPAAGSVDSSVESTGQLIGVCMCVCGGGEGGGAVCV